MTWIRNFGGPAALALLSLQTGCASGPPQLPYRAERLAPELAGGCNSAAETPAAADSTAVVPSGIALVRSEGRDVVLVAGGACVLAVDPVGPPPSPLRTGKGAIDSTAVDARDTLLLIVSASSGTARWVDTKTGEIMHEVKGLENPLGGRLLPGGAALLAVFDSGQVVELRPQADARAVMIATGLAGPVGIAIANATTAYVTEMMAGRVTRIGLKTPQRKVIAAGLKLPQGIALLPDGRLAVVDQGMRRVVAIEPEDGAQETLVDNLPIGGTAPNGDTRPDHFTDITVGRDGTMYLSSDVERSILKLTPQPPRKKQ